MECYVTLGRTEHAKEIVAVTRKSLWVADELNKRIWKFIELVARANTEMPILEGMADDLLERHVQEQQNIAGDPWKHIPDQYRGMWSVDHDREVFFVHCNGHKICDAEDSEVAFAICKAYNLAMRGR